MRHYSESENLSISQVTATSKIWGFAAGLLAICIPLSPATKSGVILPLAIISGAAVGTVAVWRASDSQSRNSASLVKSMKALEQRVANLEEVICSNTELDLQNKIKQLRVRD
jgi:hypothetical protein